MGINALYLGPVFQSKKHGYDTSDYYTVDCRLGDNASFKRICDELHANGIRIVLDGVFNHVGRDFDKFKDIQNNGSSSPYCGWFHNVNFGARSPHGDNFSYEGWQGHYDLVKLNLRNRDVVNYLLGAVSMWMDEFGIDGLRLDAADCVDPEFFKELHRMCKGKDPDFWLMGEIIHGDYTRWANPDMLDSVTNYECYKGIYSSHNDKNYFEIAHSMQRQFSSGGIYKNLCLYNFVDNHDVNRIGSTLKNLNHMKNVHTLLFTMPGVPSIYYGSEWAIEGVRTNHSDQMLRPTLELSSLPSKMTDLVPHIGRLSALRREFKALREGDFENVLIRNEQLVYKRSADGQTVFTALNVNDSEYWADIPVNGGCVLTDVLIDGSEYRVSNGRVSVMIPANGSRVLILHNGEFNYGEFLNRATSDVVEAAGVERTAHIESSTDDTPAQIQEPDIKHGAYRGCDGKNYAVIAKATDALTGKQSVIYKQLFDDARIWVMDAMSFSGTVEQGGARVPRFTYTGQD